MMHSLTILQRFLNRAHYAQSNLLKFCYILSAVLFLSCGNEVKTNKEVESLPPADSEAISEEKNSTKTILCFGDSITAGYGLEDVNDAYPGVLQSKIDSLGLDYEVINSGLSGETSSGGSNRIKWILNQEIDIFILELGANDGLRGVPLSETRTNLQAIIDAVRSESPETTIVLAGMELPPNMGKEYTSEFRAIFSDLAEKNDVVLIPFILKDVGGVTSLNQSDGIHPTVEGHKIVANTVWDVLKDVVN